MPWTCKKAAGPGDLLDKFAMHFLTRFPFVAWWDVGCAGQAPDDRKAGQRRVDEGNGLAHMRGASFPLPSETRRARSVFPRRSCRPSFPPFPNRQHFPVAHTMNFETQESIHRPRPLGTGLVRLRVTCIGKSRRRSIHGPQGTAQGNGGSAAQGGIRALPESLPFQTSARHDSIVGALPGPARVFDSRKPVAFSSREIPFPITFPKRSSSCP